MDVAYVRFTMIDQSGMSPFVQSSFAYAHHWGPLATVAKTASIISMSRYLPGLARQLVPIQDPLRTVRIHEV